MLVDLETQVGRQPASRKPTHQSLRGHPTGEGPPSGLLGLQRSAGNAAVASLLSRNEERHRPPRSSTCFPASSQAQPARIVVQRDQLDVTTSTVTAAYAQGLDDAALQGAVVRARAVISDPAVRDNLATLLDEQAQRALSASALPEGDVDPASAPFQDYLARVADLEGLGRRPSHDLDVAAIPAGQALVLDDVGSLALVDAGAVHVVDDDLLPVLDGLADAAAGGSLPGAAVGGDQEQLTVWPDGRALLGPPASQDAAHMLLTGRPVDGLPLSDIGFSSRPWNRVRDAAAAGVFRSGIYQLGTFPVSRFLGRSLPAGSRIRFATPTWPAQWKFRPGLPADTRLVEVFEPGTKRFFAWDAHVTPVGSSKPHPFYHVNQKGMHGLFGASDISPIAAADLPAARGLRFARTGGRVLLIVGVAVDAYTLTQSAVQSAHSGTPRPLLAQAVRVAGSWGGAWAGAKLMCAGGALATSETGPGAVVGCIVGGAIGGFAGYYGADWIADMISPD